MSESFDEQEASRTLGEPVSLYFFRYGDDPQAYYAFTDSEKPIATMFDPEIGEVTFQPETIKHSAITASGTLDKSSLDVRTPHDTEISLLWREHPPSQVVELTIFQGHQSNPDYRVVWSGRVLGGSLENDESIFTCEPVSTSLRRPGLTRNYQYGCPHAVYSQGDGLCNADMAAATITTSVVDVEGAILTLPNGWAPNDLKIKYIGGMIAWTRDDGRREVRGVIRLPSTNQMIISGVALGLSAGMAVELTYGCNHIWDEDCSNLHNNVVNFGGQPWIPLKNPIGIVNIYQ